MLKNSRWFDDEWAVYNRGPYLQLYKSGWYNHNNSGVHFETFIEAAQLKKKDLSNLNARGGGLPLSDRIHSKIFMP